MSVTVLLMCFYLIIGAGIAGLMGDFFTASVCLVGFMLTLHVEFK